MNLGELDALGLEDAALVHLALQRVLQLMTSARNQRCSFGHALDSAGRGYEWAMNFLLVVLMMFSPALYGVFALGFGQLQAMFNLILQLDKVLFLLDKSEDSSQISGEFDE